MIYLKEANLEDGEKEYEAIRQIPFYENGYENRFAFMSHDAFITQGLKKMVGYKYPGQPGRVPETYFFLWDDDTIVGLFKIRHYLNEELRKGAGHIGYGILEQYRNRGYGTKGLSLAKEICRWLIKEDEIYLASYSANKASLAIQLNNGAYIKEERDGVVYTRIPLR